MARNGDQGPQVQKQWARRGLSLSMIVGAYQKVAGLHINHPPPSRVQCQQHLPVPRVISGQQEVANGSTMTTPTAHYSSTIRSGSTTTCVSTARRYSKYLDESNHDVHQAYAVLAASLSPLRQGLLTLGNNSRPPSTECVANLHHLQHGGHWESLSLVAPARTHTATHTRLF
jgi:hypothetical protein